MVSFSCRSRSRSAAVASYCCSSSSFLACNITEGKKARVTTGYGQGHCSAPHHKLSDSSFSVLQQPPGPCRPSATFCRCRNRACFARFIARWRSSFSSAAVAAAVAAGVGSVIGGGARRSDDGSTRSGAANKSPKGGSSKSGGHPSCGAWSDMTSAGCGSPRGSTRCVYIHPKRAILRAAGGGLPTLAKRGVCCAQGRCRKAVRE